MEDSKTLLRKDVAKEATWNREIVYDSWSAWQQEYELALAEFPRLQAFSGTLGAGTQQLVKWFDERNRQWRRVLKLFGYARMAMVVDTTDDEAKGPYGQAISLYSQFKTATSFAKPELLSIGDEVLSWCQEQPDLAIYQHYIKNLLRQKSHRRSGRSRLPARVLQTCNPTVGPIETRQSTVEYSSLFPL